MNSDAEDVAGQQAPTESGTNGGASVPGIADEPPAAAPAPAYASMTFEQMQQKVHQSDVIVRMLRSRNTDFRNKILAMQDAFVRTFSLRSVEIGHPAAEIFPIEVRRSPTAKVRVLAFGSMGANFGMPPKQFFNAFESRDVEILFFKDFRQCWYQQGLRGRNSSVNDTITYLRRMIADDDRPIATVGASSGGFAAILFGAALGAGKMIAFSPQTKVTERVFGRFRSEDSVIDEIDFGSETTDLRKMLQHTPLIGRAQVYYSERAPQDVLEAKNLEGVENVDLHPLKWNGHNTARYLRDQKRLDGILDDFVTPDPEHVERWKGMLASMRAEIANAPDSAGGI